MREQTCFFTGHRQIPDAETRQIYEKTYLLCESLAEKLNIRTFICGGALGFDTLAARAVLALRKQRGDVRLHLMLPCKAQAAKWTAADRAVYEEILRSADAVEYVSEVYTPYCMHARNRAMVDASVCGVVFLRKNSGGTVYTVKYALSQGVKLYSVDRVASKEQG